MSISTYQNQKGETLWKAYINIRSQINPVIRAQQTIKGIKSEREAIREETRILRECEREILEKEALGSSWGAVVDAWEVYIKHDAPLLTETTRIDYVAAVRKHTNQWYKRPAASITKHDIRELLHNMVTQGNSQGFQKRLKGLLNQVFTFGIDNNLIRGTDRSPTFGVKLERQEQKKPEILTAGEIQKLLQEARKQEHPWFPIWLAAFLTGMRSGELYALNWQDVNWENHSITVNKSYNGRMNTIKSTKSGDWRTVPMSNELETLLKELQSKTGSSPFVFHHFRDWTRGLQAEVLRTFCLAIKIPSVRFHTLRACFATQLLQKGVPSVTIQKIGGWTDLKTMQRYIRLAGIETDGATEVLSGFSTKS